MIQAATAAQQYPILMRNWQVQDILGVGRMLTTEELLFLLTMIHDLLIDRPPPAFVKPCAKSRDAQFRAESVRTATRISVM